MTLLAFLLLFAATLAGYALNRYAAAGIAASGQRLHSLKGFHGGYSALLIGVPLLVLLLLWLVLQGPVVDRIVVSGLPDEATQGAASVPLLLSEIKSLARGQVFGTPEPWKTEAAARLNELNQSGGILLAVIVGALALFQTTSMTSLTAS
jgi:phosphate transport system permease protein